MPIPDYQTLMLPLLQFAADGNAHTRREAVEVLAAEFQLPTAERNELLASGQQAVFVESPRRGERRITALGEDRYLATSRQELTSSIVNAFAKSSNFAMHRGTVESTATTVTRATSVSDGAFLRTLGDSSAQHP